MIGQTISHYRILSKLGEGGMGIVYKAEDVKLKRTVALKFLPPNDTEGRERFVREAQAAASLNHQNICTIHEIDEDHGFIAMEFLEGATLKDKIAQRPLPLAEAIDIAIQTCQGLQRAHEKGVVHRDIKPANLMIVPTGQAKIMDFGLAQVGDRTRITKTGASIGTPAYMSPEQAKGETVDRRTDIWSLGAVLYEMMIGRPPFKGETEQAVSYGIVHSEPEPLTSLRTGLPTELDRIVGKALAKDPAQRYQNIEDLLVDVRRLPLARPILGRPPRWRDYLPWMAAMALTGLICGLGVWSVMRHSETSLDSSERLVIALPTGAPRISVEMGRMAAFRGRSLAISPDGRTLVYVGPGGTRSSRLFVRSLGAFEPRALDGTDGASAPFFSPDGQSVAFFASNALKRVPLIGGPVTTICETSENTGGSGGTWGPDNTIVFAEPTSARAGLLRVSASGGASQPLTTPDPAEEGSHGDPSFIEGTRSVLFTTRLTKAGVPVSIMLHSMTTNRQYKLTGLGGTTQSPNASATFAGEYSLPKYTRKGFLVFRRGSGIVAIAFRPDTLKVDGPAIPIVENAGEFDLSLGGRLLYVSTSAYGGELVWVNRDGSTQSVLDKPEQSYGRPRVSPDGSLLAVEVLRGSRSDIGIYRVRNHTLALLTNDGRSNSPYWHPDGRRIVFRTSRGLVWQSADGSAPQEVLVGTGDPSIRSASALAPGAFSPDGSTFVFVVHKSTATGADIFRLQLGRDHRIEPVVERPGNQWAVRISPDGKWISYASDESGRFEVYMETLHGGNARHQISNGGGSEPVWSPMGNELFYRVGDRMLAVPITKNPDSPAGAAHVLFTGGFQKTDLPHYDVTSNGQRFLMVAPSVDDFESRIIRMVDRWFVDVRRQ